MVSMVVCECAVVFAFWDTLRKGISYPLNVLPNHLLWGCLKKLLRKGISYSLIVLFNHILWGVLKNSCAKVFPSLCCTIQSYAVGCFKKLLRKGISFPLLYYSIICCVCKCVALGWVSIFNLPLKPLCKRSLRLLTFCPKFGRMWFIDNFLENFYI